MQEPCTATLANWSDDHKRTHSSRLPSLYVLAVSVCVWCARLLYSCCSATIRNIVIRRYLREKSGIRHTQHPKRCGIMLQTHRIRRRFHRIYSINRKRKREDCMAQHVLSATPSDTTNDRTREHRWCGGVWKENYVYKIIFIHWFKLFVIQITRISKTLQSLVGWCSCTF